jgi:3-methylcrotonyl-CoA carboxylase alpha subunit
MITGVDLVEWQLRVASGERLPLLQDDLELSGHAIEARIYAEDPDRGFLPSIGRLVHLRAPVAESGVRVDTGVRAGDEISPFYDPMIAKLVAHGEDRPAALRRLAEALAAYEIVGVATNVAFLQRVLAHDAFASGRVDTGLIARHHAALFPPPAPPSAQVLVAAALGEALALAGRAEDSARASGDPYSPWHVVDPWWPNSVRHALSFVYAAGEARHEVDVRRAGAGFRAVVRSGGSEREVAATVAVRDARLVLVADGEEFTATVVADGEERHVFRAGDHCRLRLVDPLAHAGEEEAHGGHLTAPMAGTVVAVHVQPGTRVTKGMALMILEAMKMEHTIVAPSDGVVTAVNYRIGDRVKDGADLVDIGDE